MRVRQAPMSMWRGGCEQAYQGKWAQEWWWGWWRAFLSRGARVCVCEGVGEGNGGAGVEAEREWRCWKEGREKRAKGVGVVVSGGGGGGAACTVKLLLTSAVY